MTGVRVLGDVGLCQVRLVSLSHTHTHSRHTHTLPSPLSLVRLVSASSGWMAPFGHARLLFSKSRDGKGANGSKNRPHDAYPVTLNHAAKGSVFVNLRNAGNLEHTGVRVLGDVSLCQVRLVAHLPRTSLIRNQKKKDIFIERMTSDRKQKGSREGSKEGSTGSKRLDDTRCTTCRRRMNYHKKQPFPRTLQFHR